MDDEFFRKKKQKLDRVRPLLKQGIDISESNLSFDCLPTELRQEYGLAETDNVSAHGYDEYALEIIKDNHDGLILDCGSGKRSDYFNMTKGGMRLLFEKHLVIDRQSIIRSGLPIFTLTWILQRWIHALPQEAREHFMSKRVADLLASPIDYLDENFVQDLPEEMNEELASTTALFATKI